jgi:hypothetical protein
MERWEEESKPDEGELKSVWRFREGGEWVEWVREWA